MSDTRFDVTFIRGPRDVSPWKRASRYIELNTNSPQSEPTALQAQMVHEQKRSCLEPGRFPNAIYQQKGWN